MKLVDLVREDLVNAARNGYNILDDPYYTDLNIAQELCGDLVADTYDDYTVDAVAAAVEQVRNERAGRG